MNSEASIVFSKINIKRNIDSYNFVNMLSYDKKKKLESEVVDLISGINTDSQIYDLSDLNEAEKNLFLEEDLLSSDFFNKNDGKFIYILEKNLSILLNDNDHLNIFIVKPGFDFNDAYTKIEEIEDKLSKHFNFAASNKYGFLTSNIKNSGIAMKLNVIVHLYGLSSAGKIKETIKTFSERGYIITPWVYKKEDTTFNYFNVSTKLTFGVSEKNLLSRFISGIENLLKINNDALLDYYNNNKEKLVDSIFRSFGLLRFANRMDYEEALTHLSNIRVGLQLGLELSATIDQLNKAFLEIKDAYVVKFAKENDIEDKDRARTIILKKIFNEAKDV